MRGSCVCVQIVAHIYSVPSICTYLCVIRVRVESHKELFFTDAHTDTHMDHVQINGPLYSYWALPWYSWLSDQLLYKWGTFREQQNPTKHGTPTQCWVKVGPPSTTLCHHLPSIGTFSRVCWSDILRPWHCALPVTPGSHHHTLNCHDSGHQSPSTYYARWNNVVVCPMVL